MSLVYLNDSVGVVTAIQAISYQIDAASVTVATKTVPYPPGLPLPSGFSTSLLYSTNPDGATIATISTAIVPHTPGALIPSVSSIPAVTASIETTPTGVGTVSGSDSALAASSPTISPSSGTPTGTSSTSKPKSRPSPTTGVTSQTSDSSSSGHAPASTTNSPNHTLANGAVAGIVIAAALGLALVTFIATFLIMRPKRTSRMEQRHGKSNQNDGFESRTANRQSPLPEPKKPLVSEASSVPSILENYLPQSADDQSVQSEAKIMLDQVELYVENFYVNNSGFPSPRSAPGTDMAFFNSPHLPKSLTVLLPQSRNAILLIKHALAQFVTSSISTSSRSGSSLLPDEFLLVPAAVESNKTGGSRRPGFDQCMSRWRVLTAYLRPTPSQDPAYIAQRDYRIEDSVTRFSRAFAPWQNSKHENDVRNRSLSAILRSAADLGIFLFSQPSDLRFYWPKQNEVGANRVVVTPSLVKLTDERGQALAESQVMLKAVIEKD